MTTILRQRLTAVKKGAKMKTTKEGWILPKEPTSFADPDSWTNKDSDVTPLERRTWTSLTILGFWVSDAMNAQGWMAPAAIIAVGLTWREAVYCIILGSLMDTIPLCLNGAIGADLHVPFPIALRSSFGFYLSRFGVVVRMCTALFWHAIQTYTGSTAMTQIIRAIWPSYLDIPNHLPASAGITSQQLLSHFIFWSVQFPVLLTPPHKLRWFFITKAVVVFVVSVAVVISMSMKAGGTGEIWKQEYTVYGSQRSWLIMSSMSSITGGWATTAWTFQVWNISQLYMLIIYLEVATNVPDFTRYMKKRQGVYWQAFFLPAISIILGMFGIISTSAAKVVYGSYIWDPVELAAQWEGPSGRCGAFFVGLCWVIAQIGTNLSANVISCSNDMVSLCPKYINIRRGVIITTVIAGWVMVPWKIISSAASLLSFMSGLAIFLAPIAAILASDYWVVKMRAIDVPSLYRRHGRYYYRYGCNWRAAVAFIISVTPNTPGLAHAVNNSVKLSGSIEHVYDMNYLYGFTSAFVVYVGLSYIFPPEGVKIPQSIYEEIIIVDGKEVVNDGLHTPVAVGSETASLDEKHLTKADIEAV